MDPQPGVHTPPPQADAGLPHDLAATAPATCADASSCASLWSSHLSTFIVTGEQIRAARALARIEQAELAAASGLSIETIKRLERIRGPINAHIRTVEALVRSLRQFGVRLDPRGVSLIATTHMASE